MSNKHSSKTEEKINRQGRVAEGRYTDMRDSDIRDMLKMGFADPLHIANIPDGWDYFWGRDTFGGEIDTARMSQLQKRGWMAVDASERPELVNPQFEGRETQLKGYITYKGLVLCKRPKRFGEIEQEMEQEASYESMITLPVHENLNSQAGWQSKVFNNETSVMKTKTFK